MTHGGSLSCREKCLHEGQCLTNQDVKKGRRLQEGVFSRFEICVVRVSDLVTNPQNANPKPVFLSSSPVQMRADARFTQPFDQTFELKFTSTKEMYRVAQNIGKQVLGKQLKYCVILHEIATATQHFPMFNEICTAAPPSQGKLLRSLYPWMNTTK